MKLALRVIIRVLQTVLEQTEELRAEFAGSPKTMDHADFVGAAHQDIQTALRRLSKVYGWL